MRESLSFGVVCPQTHKKLNIPIVKETPTFHFNLNEPVNTYFIAITTMITPLETPDSIGVPVFYPVCCFYSMFFAIVPNNSRPGKNFATLRLSLKVSTNTV